MNEVKPEGDVKFLDRNPPAFPEDLVRRVAAGSFGLEGEFKPLVSERDQNFRVTTARGERFVFKIANVDEDPGVVDLQLRGLLHVAQTDPGFPVPRVVHTKQGEPFDWADMGGGARHIVRAVSWIEGTELGDMPPTPTLLRNAGGAVARLAKALRGYHHPAARHPLLWDVTQVVGLCQHVHHIADQEGRARVERALDAFIADVLPNLSRLRGQIIHNDANGNNMVVDPANPEQVAGIIDFGDMIHTVLAADPAVTASDLSKIERHLIDSICTIVAGYDAVNPLEEDEINVIYDLILARYALTLVIIAWRNSQPSGPGYLESYEAPSHHALDVFMTLGRDKVRRALRDACRFPAYCPKPGETGIADDTKDLLKKRERFLGKTLELSYENPVHVVRGEGPWLFTADGTRLLDSYNNVPHVGHAHPHVARAIARQAAALNTNTRYLYRNILDYAERLTATMPKGLEACLFVNSGSEANDAAFRMAKQMTGNRGALVMEAAYHGISESIDALSPYDLKKRPLQPHVRTLIGPDPYRGPYKDGDGDLAAKYAADADRAIRELQEAGYGVAAFMIDSGFTSNGIPNVPAGYLKLVCEKVRAAGGMIIADEVQCGFGRMGTHMWGIETHGAIPDFITTGKPIGNGIALGVAVTRPEIRQAFGETTGFFSTFGGNPVACAAGMAVLDVVEREGLMPRAQETGEYKRSKMRELMNKHRWLGDVRGSGLLTGVELVRDRKTLEPAPEEAKRVINHMRNNGVLVGREGPHGNVLKIRPPLAFRKEHADILVEALDRALGAL
ncbi:MAG: aminotransferase class III-fold pyridoxal phosphate-dependent enzyme [Dongiaceae bacterium]